MPARSVQPGSGTARVRPEERVLGRLGCRRTVESGPERERFERFVDFIRGRKADDAFLDAVAFLHMLKACGVGGK